MDYDPQKKTVKAPPQLPAWALPGKPATVSLEKAKELQRLLKAKPTIDPAKFLSRFGVERLTALPAGKLAEAMAVLNDPPPSLVRAAA